MSSNRPPSFDEILQSSSLPSPGPDYYAARREIWLTSRPHITHRPPPPSNSRKKLEEVFSRPGAVYNEDIWANGLDKVWKGLSSGGKLRVSLPMGLIIQIIHAGWLRDKTWPAGLEVKDSGDEQQANGAPSSVATMRQSPSAQTFRTSDIMEPMPPHTISRR
ncbi:hypothetical protein JR316_0004675 [Psilocybe cubensis]|uniref:Uncharacterized protein n=2 Tax=Psilocybe cubensis TaxID=181762 RepID=A0ACB8H3K2_PSICU|nr:hypothetical protein JR316_0004675 [Psilocybe cubensis]KAH9482575.1 hypothetical protein JR316_0004675 [Psilocybe cubensis]